MIFSSWITLEMSYSLLGAGLSRESWGSGSDSRLGMQQDSKVEWQRSQPSLEQCNILGEEDA